MDAVGPDEIQLPEGVERYCTGLSGLLQPDAIGEWLRYSDLSAIIAQEREKWEAEQEVELALLGVEKCSGEGIGFHNARAEKAKDERDQAKAQALAELREALLRELEHARQWRISETERIGPSLTEAEKRRGVAVLSLADFNYALGLALSTLDQAGADLADWPFLDDPPDPL